MSFLRDLEVLAVDCQAGGARFATLRRRLERNLVQTGLLVRRARLSCLLCEANIAFREREMATARMLVVSQGLIVEHRDIASVGALAGFEPRRPKNLRERRSAFDAAAYDRMRVLVTELRRIHDDGGDIALRIGTHAFIGARLANWMLAV